MARQRVPGRLPLPEGTARGARRREHFRAKRTSARVKKVGDLNKPEACAPEGSEARRDVKVGDLNSLKHAPIRLRCKLMG